MKLISVILLLLAVTIAAATPGFLAPEWHMVNVNDSRRPHSGQQGDSHLLFDKGETVLIDAGAYKEGVRSLVPYLRKKGIRKIDHFFVSHPHTDHYGGIDALIENGITISNIYFNKPPEGVEDFDYKPYQFNAMLGRASNSGAELHDVAEGFTLKLPSTEIKVLYALKVKRTNVNDYSLIMRWDAGGYRALFTGDLNRPLGEILSREEYMSADILKVPHHGVTGIAPNSFFERVGPTINMVPAPRHLWAHPRGAQVKNWTEAKLAVAYKQEEGSLRYSCHNGFNQNVVIKFYEESLDLLPDTATRDCPRTRLAIKPKEKIDSPFDRDIAAALGPIILMLLGDD